MSGAVIEHQSPDQLRVGLRSVLHFHDLDHVEVNRFPLTADGKNSVDNGLGEGVGNLTAHLGTERGAGDRAEQLAVERVGGGLERLEELVVIMGEGGII